METGGHSVSLPVRVRTVNISRRDADNGNRDDVGAAVALLSWNRVSSIGVRAMDEQHGVLMDTLSDLRQALAQGAGRERVRKEMNRLVEFTRMHFECEERLLEQQGYPELAAHREAHERLLEQVRRVAHRELQSEEPAMLRGWYAEHVDTLDCLYGAWLNERGIV